MKLLPLISEKSYELANTQNKYTFMVPVGANKVEIRNEVEKEYKVKVESVNTVTKPGKKRTDWARRLVHRASDKKKAVVKLKSGDKIEEFFNF